MYIPLFLYGGKSAQQLSYGFNILDKLESCPNENQIPYGEMDFSKMVSKVTVWSQNFRFSYFSFLKGFPAKKWLVLHVLSLSLPPLSPSFLLVRGEKPSVREFSIENFTWN